jgi:hypothetical protein
MVARGETSGARVFSIRRGGTAPRICARLQRANSLSIRHQTFHIWLPSAARLRREWFKTLSVTLIVRPRFKITTCDLERYAWNLFGEDSARNGLVNRE